MKVALTVPRFVQSVKENRKYIVSQVDEDYYRAVLFEVLVSTGKDSNDKR